MRARGALVLLALISSPAFADEPKPKAQDVKAIRDKMQLFEDTHGGVFVVYVPPAATSDARIWYGTSNKTVYEQVVVTKSANGETGAWSFGLWTPRMSGIDPSTVQRKDDGTFERWCGNKEQTALKLVPADRAKPILEKAQFNSSAITHRSRFLARDDSGVYYYVDMISKDYGGEGYRVYMGKKGAMKQLPLTDVANDTGGQVYSTKSGDIRFVIDTSDHAKDKAYFIKGEKKVELSILNLDMNSRVIWNDLGIYPFLGTPCDEL